MTTVLVRADGSTVLGMGNITRSLSIAEVFQARGADIVFAARDLDPRVRAHVEAMGCRFWPLPSVLEIDDDVARTRTAAHESGASYLVIDLANPEATHDVAQYSRYMQGIVDPFSVLVIDDLTRAVFPRCTVVNMNTDVAEAEYDSRLGPRFLLGPRFAILRGTYRDAARTKRYSDGAVRRVVISLGGGIVATELLTTVLEGTRLAFGNGLHVDLLTGLGNADQLHTVLADFDSVNTIANAPSLRDLLLECDLAFVSGGVTKFEAAATGTAMVVVPSIDHQEPWGRSFARTGAAIYAGNVGAVTADDLTVLCRPLQDAQVRKTMGTRGAELVDGHGAQRIVDRTLALEQTEQP